MQDGSPLAVFFNGPASVDAAMAFAAAGAKVLLMGSSRDQLDEAGRQIIQTMDSLVHTGTLSSDQRFAVYSHVQKIIFSELEDEVTLYLDAAGDESQLKESDAFLATRGPGLVLTLRGGGNVPVGTQGGHTRVLLSVTGPFTQAREVQVSPGREEDGAPLEKVKGDVSALLENMGKKAVFA